MKRSQLIINMTVGGIGAFGQALLLAHKLDSYPFRILNSPPERFFVTTGWSLVFIAPPLSLLLLYLFRSTLRPLVTAIPVVASLLLYWVLFRLVFSLSGYHYVPESKANDLVAARSIENGFSALVVSLTLAGLAIGSACGLVLWLLFRKVRAERAV
jgi:hypothetical protein